MPSPGASRVGNMLDYYYYYFFWPGCPLVLFDPSPWYVLTLTTREILIHSSNVISLPRPGSIPPGGAWRAPVSTMPSSPINLSLPAPPRHNRDVLCMCLLYAYRVSGGCLCIFQETESFCGKDCFFRFVLPS